MKLEKDIEELRKQREKRMKLQKDIEEKQRQLKKGKEREVLKSAMVKQLE